MEITNIYNLIILDESGSMESIKAAALAGCNETLQSIRKRQEKHKEEQKHFITMVTFNSENSAKVVIDTMPIAVVNDFPKEMYNPDSCTPLYDAMGLSFEDRKSVV